MHLILLGAPGSGKGTQANRIVAEFGLVHISTGDMLREAIASGTDLGVLIEHYINAGHLVPDHQVTSLVDQRLDRDDIARGFVIDGFPRTVRQADCLDEILGFRKFALDAVALIDVPDEIVVDRMAGRRMDPETGRIYNLNVDADQPPPEIIPLLQKREDDREDVIRERLRTFHDQTDPVIEHYEARGELVRVDGTRSPDAVFEALSAHIQPAQKPR